MQWNATSESSASAEPMDVYIAPVNPSVCPRHDDHKSFRILGYTATVNLLDFTACTIPVTFVDDEIDRADERSGKRDGRGSEIPGVTCELDGIIKKNHGNGGYDGLPVGFQVVGRRFEEEKILGIARVLEKLLKG